MRPNRNPLRAVLRVSTETPLRPVRGPRDWTCELECGHEKVVRAGSVVTVLPERIRCRFCGVLAARSVEEEL